MKRILSVLIVLFSISGIYAQSNKVITEILNSEQATFGQACYISAVYQGLINEDASYEQAINVLYEQKQIPEKIYETNPVAMINLAFIYAQMWNIKGGMMYRITNGSPRYAFKQMKSDGVIAENIAPEKLVSGYEMLSLFTQCNIEYGNMTVSVE